MIFNAIIFMIVSPLVFGGPKRLGERFMFPGRKFRYSYSHRFHTGIVIHDPTIYESTPTTSTTVTTKMPDLPILFSPKLNNVINVQSIKSVKFEIVNNLGF